MVCKNKLTFSLIELDHSLTLCLYMHFKKVESQFLYFFKILKVHDWYASAVHRKKKLTECYYQFILFIYLSEK